EKSSRNLIIVAVLPNFSRATSYSALGRRQAHSIIESTGSDHSASQEISPRPNGKRRRHNADLHISAARIAARRRVWLILRAARLGAARRPAWRGARGW